MISSLAWVPKGASKEVPVRFKMTDEDFDRIQANISSRLATSKSELEAAQMELAADGASPEGNSDAAGAQMVKNKKKRKGQSKENAAAAGATDGNKGKGKATEPNPEDEAIIKEFALDNYDDEDEVENEDDDEMAAEDMDDSEQAKMAAALASNSAEDGALFGTIQSLKYHDKGGEDPFVTQDDKVEEDEELEEAMISVNDNLILAAKTEDDISHIEVYLYEGGEDNLFVHHDIMLPSFPLCLEWLNFPLPSSTTESSSLASQTGNFVAVGMFDPEIEIWNLDVLDPMYPDAILGGKADAPKVALGSGKKKSRLRQPHPHYHVDAVLCLSWNRAHPSLLASGSADTTIKLWDLNSPDQALRSFQPHHAKVQGLAWNSKQPEVLASGAYDKRACVFDTRAPDAVMSFKLSADVEVIRWDPFRPERLLVSTEDGVVRCFDGTAPSAPLFTLHAHDGAVSAMDMSPTVPGLLVTGSADRTCKVWATDVLGATGSSGTAAAADAASGDRRCLVKRDLGLGKVFSATFAPDTDDACRVAVAGDSGSVTVWHLDGNDTVKQYIRGARSQAGLPDIRGTFEKEFLTMDTVSEDDEDDDGGLGVMMGGDGDEDEDEAMED